jgi:branched-chain amino acid aminotransferase
VDSLVYLNGELVPEEQAKISIFDIGFLYSAVFMEALRTFQGEPFRMEDHLVRMDRSLRAAGIGSLIAKDEVRRAVETVLAANRPRFADDEDCWICVQVTPGRGFPQPLMRGKAGRPTVMAYVTPLPFDEYAECYRKGKAGVVTSVRNVPPQVVDPRAKTRFRLHYFVAKREAMQQDPDAFAILLDTDGFVTEGTGANLFVVRDGQLLTPTTRNILEGVSRRVAIEIARELGVPVFERDLTPYDLATADEGFWTTSSYCMLPLAGVNGARLPAVPGAVTERILRRWSEKVGVDIVAQAEKYRGRPSNVWRAPEQVAVQGEGA